MAETLSVVKQSACTERTAESCAEEGSAGTRRPRQRQLSCESTVSVTLSSSLESSAGSVSENRRLAKQAEEEKEEERESDGTGVGDEEDRGPLSNTESDIAPQVPSNSGEFSTTSNPEFHPRGTGTRCVVRDRGEIASVTTPPNKPLVGNSDAAERVVARFSPSGSHSFGASTERLNKNNLHSYSRSVSGGSLHNGGKGGGSSSGSGGGSVNIKASSKSPQPSAPVQLVRPFPVKKKSPPILDGASVGNGAKVVPVTILAPQAGAAAAYNRKPAVATPAAAAAPCRGKAPSLTPRTASGEYSSEQQPRQEEERAHPQKQAQPQPEKADSDRREHDVQLLQQQRLAEDVRVLETRRKEQQEKERREWEQEEARRRQQQLEQEEARRLKKQQQEQLQQRQRQQQHLEQQKKAQQQLELQQQVQKEEAAARAREVKERQQREREEVKRRHDTQCAFPMSQRSRQQQHRQQFMNPAKNVNMGTPNKDAGHRAVAQQQHAQNSPAPPVKQVTTTNAAPYSNPRPSSKSAGRAVVSSVSSARSAHSGDIDGGGPAPPPPTLLFERLVSEEVQELKAYARMIESQNRRLAELERVHEDLEARLERQTAERVELEATLERREREWAANCAELKSERDQWKEAVQAEQTKNERLLDLVYRKDKEIHRMIQRKYDTGQQHHDHGHSHRSHGIKRSNSDKQKDGRHGGGGVPGSVNANQFVSETERRVHPDTQHKSPQEILATSGSVEAVRERNVTNSLLDFFGM